MSKNTEERLFDEWQASGPSDDYEDGGSVDTGEMKLDIRDEMSNADFRNLNFYNDIHPKQQKLFEKAMYTNMRWFSSVNDRSFAKGYYVQMANEILNKDYSVLSKHPELFWKLMAACGIGEKQYHYWINPPKRKRKTGAIADFLLQWYPSANNMELDLMIKQSTRESFEEFVKSTGAPDDELKSLLKAYDAETGKAGDGAEKAPSKAKARKK